MKYTIYNFLPDW